MFKLIFTLLLLLPISTNNETSVVTVVSPVPVKQFETVLATYYYLPGCLTASGSKYSLTEYECAFNKFSIGTYLKIWYKNTVIKCKITDRTPGEKEFIDLNLKSARKLKLKTGIVKYGRL